MDIGQALKKARSDIDRAKRELDEARRVLQRARNVENHYRQMLKGGMVKEADPARGEDTPESP